MSFIEHIDDRRVLYEYANGNFKSAKAILIKETIKVGGHYHNNKDEIFFLLQGKILQQQIGYVLEFMIDAPYSVFVPRGIPHTFICEAGSILLSVATELYDPADEHKITMKELIA